MADLFDLCDVVVEIVVNPLINFDHQRRGGDPAGFAFSVCRVNVMSFYLIGRVAFVSSSSSLSLFGSSSFFEAVSLCWRRVIRSSRFLSGEMCTESRAPALCSMRIYPAHTQQQR